MYASVYFLPTFAFHYLTFLLFAAFPTCLQGELRGRSFSQEEATTIIDVTSPESETLTLGETEMNAAQGGERALNGRAKEMKAMVTETTFEAPSTEVMDNFMTEHHMMKGVSLPMQKISKRNTIKVNGAVHSLDNLIPMNVVSSVDSFQKLKQI